MRRLNRLHVGLALSILLFLLLGYWLIKPEIADQSPYLSFSADVDGTKAWRELLRTKQPAVKEWRLDWNNLPGETNMLLVAIQPNAVSKSDREQLLKWVRQGNDFVLFDRHPEGWSQWTTERVDRGAEADGKNGKNKGKDKGNNEAKNQDKNQDKNEDKNEDKNQDKNAGWDMDLAGKIAGAKQAVAIQAGPEFTTAEGPLTGEVDTPYRLKAGDEGQTLFADESGVLASRFQVGAGNITVVLTPNWMQNGTIDRASHFELIWPLFAKSWHAVWVDETHHGLGTKPGLLAVYPAWLVLASVQLGLALLMWLWLRGKRFGSVHTPRAWTVRRGDEGVLAVAAWYERLGFRDEALAHQQQLLRQLLAQRWGLSPSVSAVQAAAAARGRWPEEQAARLARLLEDWPPAADGGDGSVPRAAKQRGVNAKAFVERTREMGDMIAYLEKE
ncbi:DUF4350 domain-containing protein [Paenibacillus sp. SI8]|uniref:DUF4350 domain-containing protein n=1 Tax=unclassified Paenibacillus TaxID=185978 RepID=UPI0034657EAC